MPEERLFKMERSGRPSKRARLERAEEEMPGPSNSSDEPDVQLILYARWFGPSGQTKVNRLDLRAIPGHDSLEVGFGTSACHQPASCLPVLVLKATLAARTALVPLW